MICSACASHVYDDGICSHHFVTEDEWAAANRVWCDMVHRGRLPARVAPEDREAMTDYMPTANTEPDWIPSG